MNGDEKERIATNMWIFTVFGFFSVTTSKPNGKIKRGELMVRARNRRHLERLISAFPALKQYQIMETPAADYRFRIVLPQKTWAKVLEGMALAQDYPNFKDEAARRLGADDPEYIRILHDLWHRMWGYQDECERDKIFR